MATAACVVSPSAAKTVYETDFTTFTADDFAAWKVIDANGDEKTWILDESGMPSHVFYSYHNTNTGDDWLISPEVTIPADGTYVLNYQFFGSSYGEAFDVWVGDTPDVEGMTMKIAEHSDVKNSLAGNLAFADLKAGTMHFAFHCTTPPDKYRLYITSASLIEASNPVDICVSEITSPVSGEGLGMENVTVKISNRGRVDIDSFDVAYSLNGSDPVTEHIGTLLAAGDEMEYTFSTPADLSTGHFTHTLKAWTIHPDDLNPANDAIETKVKHIAPAAVPYRMGFEPDEDTSMMQFLNLNQDSGDWSINIDSGWFGKFARTGYGCLAYNYDSNNAADDWAFLEPIEMEAGHYALKFWYSSTENHKERMRVYWGDAPTPEAMTNLLAEYDSIENETYLEGIHIFEVKEPGQVYIGFYCYSDANENWLVVDDLSIDKVDPDLFDLIVKDVKSPASVMREGSLTDISFSMLNVGIKDAGVTVNAYLDGEKLTSAEYTVRGQETVSVKLENALEGISTGKHILKIEALCEGDSDLSNNVVEKEVVVMAEAVKLWDFEDGELPTDLTLRKEDYGTDHPDAGDEFNENGFGIFSLEHVLLGKKALAVNTWFTDDTTADRWVVLPQATVTGKDVYFVWNANSYNPDFREKYSVCVSKSDDHWMSYQDVYKVSAEDISPQTHGISLSDYEGETVYIAIHIQTKSGEALILDNLGIYGDIVLGSVGVDKVDTDSFRTLIENDRLDVYGVESASIRIYDLDGRSVIAIEGQSADLSGLSSGVYVAKIATSDRVETIKFAR